MTEKLYKIQQTKKKGKKAKVRFVLTEQSEFPGVVVEFRDIKILEAAKPDGTNCEISYNIIKVPKGKYKDMEDSKKQIFEETIRGVFTDLLRESMNEFENAQKLQKAQELNR